MNVPAWIVVEMRLPKPPKMLPRMPMAAGHQHEEAGELLERAGDRAEERPGDEARGWS